MLDATLRVTTQDQESNSKPDAPVSPLSTPRSHVAYGNNVVPIFSAKKRAQNASTNMRGKASEASDSRFKYPMLECK